MARLFPKSGIAMPNYDVHVAEDVPEGGHWRTAALYWSPTLRQSFWQIEYHVNDTWYYACLLHGVVHLCPLSFSVGKACQFFDEHIARQIQEQLKEALETRGKTTWYSNASVD